MRWIKFFIALFVTVAVSAALYFPSDTAPFSLGNFLDPFHGFWQNAEPVVVDWEESVSLPGIAKPAKVVFDARRVPHIFAGNLVDAAYIQGYITARDRLWQMEFQTHAAAGRLTELVGRGPEDRVLNLDRETRRKGIPFGAARSQETVLSDPVTKSILEAYTEGVNTWINQLDYASLPLEYKLLNYRPEPWSLYKICLLMKYMANTLAARATDIQHTNALALWGREIYDILYPEFPLNDQPIIPADTRWPRARAGSTTPLPPADYHPDSLLFGTAPEAPDYDVGSNNWAVAGNKSVTGRPILANDPHLGLSLPSIWYELQIHTPDINVYGVSIPGAPGVILGFNDSIAWGQTNAGQDVMDFYALEFRDNRRKEYFYDGQWLPVKEEIETFRIKGGEIYYDTVLYTHVGPVMYDENFGNQSVSLAVRWMAHEPSNEALTYIKLASSRNYEDYVDALKHFECPAQNFVFASASGDIAIWQQGKYVNKWREQGRFVLDGSRKDHMWNDFIPQDQNPHVFNPPQGFVSSANQHPTSPFYPYYYTGSFDAFRGRRIHKLLSEKDTVTIADMKRFQLDNFSNLAADVLPTMLSDLDTIVYDTKTLEVYQMMKDWNYEYNKENAEPTVFNLWWEELYRSIWADEFKAVELALSGPDNSTTARILTDSLEFMFFKHVGDSNWVNRKMLVNESFHRALNKLFEDFPDQDDWKWAFRKTTDIRHLSRSLPSMSRMGLPTDGDKQILNATGRTHAPSWRMIVALGDEVEAYGVYPGGQSGNPGSAYYDDFIDNWVEGEYYSLWFMQSSDEKRDSIMSTQVFSP